MRMIPEQASQKIGPKRSGAVLPRPIPSQCLTDHCPGGGVAPLSWPEGPESDGVPGSPLVWPMLV